MKNPQIADIIQKDAWTQVEGDAEGMAVHVRFRERLLEIENTEGYEELLTIAWPYAEEGSGEMPSDELSAKLDEFETRLADALEKDAHAVIAAVITVDGVRQWIVYTAEVEECGQRIASMPQEEEPYPIEMQADEDPNWDVLHELVCSECEDEEDEEGGEDGEDGDKNEHKH